MFITYRFFYTPNFQLKFNSEVFFVILKSHFQEFFLIDDNLSNSLHSHVYDFIYMLQIFPTILNTVELENTQLIFKIPLSNFIISNGNEFFLVVLYMVYNIYAHHVVYKNLVQLKNSFLEMKLNRRYFT